MKRGAVVGFVLVLMLLMSVFPKSILPEAHTVHDVGVTIVASSKTVVGQGYSLNVTVTVADLGDYPETFNVTVYANTAVVGTHTVKSLLNGTTTRLGSSWNTTGFAKGNYTISAYARPVAGETNLANNNFTSPTAVMVTILPADLMPPFGAIDMKDIAYIAKRFNTDPSNPLWDPNADFDDSGKIDMKDIAVVATHAFTYASVVASQLKGFGLFVRYPNATFAQSKGYPYSYSYITDADWSAWNAWNTKNVYGENAFWLDQELFLAWDWDTLLARLKDGNIKYIYVQAFAFRTADHVLEDRYKTFTPMPAGFVRGFVDYVHANSNIKIMAWGWMNENIVSISTSAYRQQMVNQILAFVNTYGFDGCFEDTENLGINTAANLRDYWNLMGSTMRSNGKMSFIAIAIWLVESVAQYVNQLDYMELMDYFAAPVPLADFINYINIALNYCGSPVIWGLHTYVPHPEQDGALTTAQQLTAIDDYLNSQ